MTRQSSIHTRPAPAAAGQSDCRHSESARGIVQEVNLIERDLAVSLPSGLAVFDVPPDCPILLHGERIKLRMIMPRDPVVVKYRRRAGLLVAETVEVKPAIPSLKSPPN